MLQRMQADFCFCNPDDAGPQPRCSSSTASMSRTSTIGSTNAARRFLSEPKSPSRSTEDHFLHWVQSVVEPLGGDTMEAGLADPPADGRAGLH